MFRSVAFRVATRHELKIALSGVCISPYRCLHTESVTAPKRPLPSSAYPSPRRPHGAVKGGSETSRKSSPVKPQQQEQPAQEVHLLRPAVLSERIKKLCQKDKLDDAVTLLKNSPLDAQNTVVWNTMISETMKERRYKLAYQLYVDMKRRGFTPTFSTYVTLMTGYARIEDWDTYSKQLDNVHTVMQNFTQFAEAAKKDPAISNSLLPVPQNMYIRILGDARQYQKMFDVYYSMDQTGPLAPNQHTYSSMLHALSERRAIPGIESIEAVHAQNASDARLIWKQYTKAFADDPEDRVIVAFLRCLRYGRPSDVLFGFEVVREYCGLSKPGEDHLPAKVPMGPHLVGAILDLCLYSQKHRLAIHYAQQIIDRPLKEGADLPVDRANMEQLLQAYNHLGALGSMGEADQALETLRWMLRQEALNPRYAHKIRPRLETYACVLVACWRGGDWASATRTFELLTGCRSSEFADDHTGRINITRRPKESRFEPDEMVLSAMLRTSFASRDPANMRQCLRIVEYYKVREMLVNTISLIQEKIQWNKPRTDRDGAELTKIGQIVRNKKESMDRRFYGAKLAEAVIEVVDKVMPYSPRALEEGTVSRRPSSNIESSLSGNESHHVTKEERQRWFDLRQKAKETLRETKRAKTLLIAPRHEGNPLGSAQGVAHTDRRVDYEMVSRHTRSV